ncbi:MAG: cytidine deaminase [Bacilli bacterium]|nr:cytidine deaminase [Bacilli bacterium]
MNQELKQAIEAKQIAYSPYSNFEVGAILKCKNGNIYRGCNIENNGIQSICAERTAFAKALSEGEREFESITVVGSEKGKDIDEECLPCGYCRQFISEFVDKEFKIITYDGKEIKEYKIDELLPHSFKLDK